MKEKRDVASPKTTCGIIAKTAFELARSVGISRLVVQADVFHDIYRIEALRQSESIVWITRNGDEIAAVQRRNDIVVRIPPTALSRMNQLHIALFLAVLNDGLKPDETVLCLTGATGVGHLDMLLITTPARYLPRFHKHRHPFLATRDLARILEIALRFAVEGREGAPIGTLFVLGEPEGLRPYLRQLVLNPCEGHPRERRSIHDPEMLETLREYSAMDGAFVVSRGGTVESAATYLDAPIVEARIRSGLGARHAAAVGITEATDAVAVALSSSSGMVSVFQEGEPILELERPFRDLKRVLKPTGALPTTR